MANGKLIQYHLLALAVVAVWGVTFVSTKVLIGAGMHPVAIFFIRFVLAYAGIWLYILLSGGNRQLWFGWKDELVFLVLGVTGGSFYFLTENTVLALTGMALVVFDGARLEVSAMGDLLAIGAALCWAAYSLFMAQMTRDYGTVTATAFLGERMTLWAAIGSAAILAGVIWAGKRS